MTRVLVTGGRNYQDHRALFAVLDRLHAERPIAVVIHGARFQRGLLSGADRWAEAWAIAREVPYLGVPARSQTDGRKAEPLRNTRMLEQHKPEIVVAAPGGAGTADLVRKAKAARVDVIEVPA